jgi:hypothetical protein
MKKEYLTKTEQRLVDLYRTRCCLAESLVKVDKELMVRCSANRNEDDDALYKKAKRIEIQIEEVQNRIEKIAFKSIKTACATYW